MSSSSSSVVSVASSTSAGAAGGSVIDVNSLVSQLVAATRGPQDTQIASQTTAVTTKISAVGTLKSALSTFQSALSSLDTASSFASANASTSNAGAVTATAAAGAAPGRYQVTVSALASAQQLLSTAVPGGSGTAVGTGTLNLQLGANGFSLTIDSSNDTLTGVAAAINSATDNPGITATVIQGTDGGHLLLSSSVTGAANTIQVTETDGGGALSALTYGTGNTANYTQNAAAQDAAFTVAGVAYTSASNTVSDAISNVTLNLTGTTTTNTAANITVSNDTSTVDANIQAFVKAYNTLHASLASLGSYDSTTGTAGPMLGDALLSGVQNEISQAMHSLVGSSAYSSLASIGVTMQKDGTLAVDDTRLQKALSSSFADVSRLFTSSGGVATRLNDTLTRQLASGGSIDSRSKTLIKQNTALTAKTTTLNKQMQSMTDTLTQQYSALNVLLSSLQTTSAYLTQAIASLPTVQGKANA